MSVKISFSLAGWSAWASGIDSCIETREQWRDWAAGKLTIAPDEKMPPLDFIPALQRRRFSRLSRISLHVAYAAANGNHTRRTVFCSRHGEIYRTRGLLADLANHEPLSPMAFSLSVHNTASGLYSIASGNTAASTAIAAGRDTLAMAVIESLGQLQHANNPTEEILLVFADEPLPEDYVEFADEETAAYGLALLITKETSASATNNTQMKLQLSQHDSSNSTHKNESMGLGLLRLLSSDAPAIDTRGENSGWRWSRL